MRIIPSPLTVLPEADPEDCDRIAIWLRLEIEGLCAGEIRRKKECSAQNVPDISLSERQASSGVTVIQFLSRIEIGERS